MTIFNELDQVRGKKTKKRRLSDEVIATYDGERFGLTNGRVVIILNLREALYLYEFLGEHIRGEKADLDWLCENIP